MTRNECKDKLISLTTELHKVAEHVVSEFDTPEGRRIAELEREYEQLKASCKSETTRLGRIIEEWRLKCEKLEQETRK